MALYRVACRHFSPIARHASMKSLRGRSQCPSLPRQQRKRRDDLYSSLAQESERTVLRKDHGCASLISAACEVAIVSSSKEWLASRLCLVALQRVSSEHVLFHHSVTIADQMQCCRFMDRRRRQVCPRLVTSLSHSLYGPPWFYDGVEMTYDDS